MKHRIASFTLALSLVSFFAGSAAQADVRLPAVVSDGMVLQRQSRVPIWGWAEPGEMVRITPGWLGDGVQALSVGTSTGADGTWRIDVPTKEAGGPYELRISGKNELVVKDVWIGEVWLCSGQSNMEWKIDWVKAAVEDFDAVRAQKDHPRLRLFDVQNTITMTPQTDCKGVWKACTPDNWTSWGAVAFYYGLELLQELDVPIGLITSDWGGTPAEAWTSRQGIEAFPEFAPHLAKIDEALGTPGPEAPLPLKQKNWWRTLEEKDPGSPEWSAAELDVSAWKTMTLPGAWETTPELSGFDGIMWYRHEVELPGGWAGRDLVLELGAIDDMDTTWFNGEKVGGIEVPGKWTTPRVYQIPGKLVKGGQNTIAVRVVDTGGGGGFISETGQLAIKLAGAEGAPSRLIGGEWRYHVGPKASDLEPFPSTNWFNSHTPTSLFNGMIAPLIPYEIRGAIWYQGESNRERAAQYGTLFPSMIQDWRRLWDQGSFPFYFVQIAPYRYGGDTGQAAELREAQMYTLALPNTGMAVTMDIGNPDDIHPKNKWEVGRRLALWAFAKVYGRKDLVFSGPIYRGWQKEGSRIRVFFTNTGGGLASKVGPLTHFTIAGEDRVFHPAQVEIEGDTLVVWGDEVGNPIAVRYAWGAADEPNLMNLSGLPASSFRTDDWKRE